MRDDDRRRRASNRAPGAHADDAAGGELAASRRTLPATTCASVPGASVPASPSRMSSESARRASVTRATSPASRHVYDGRDRRRFFSLLLTSRSTSSLNADPVDAPPCQRRRSAQSEPLLGNRGRKHVTRERVLCRSRDHGSVMRGTVLTYDAESESYGVRGDFDVAPRNVPAEDVAPIPAPDQGIQSDTPDFGMFPAPAPLNLGGHRGRDAAAAILGVEALPQPRSAQGGGQSPAQLVSETPPAMASRLKSPARRTGDTEVVEVSDDSGDDGDGENGDLRRGDVFDEYGDDFNEYGDDFDEYGDEFNEYGDEFNEYGDEFNEYGDDFDEDGDDFNEDGDDFDEDIIGTDSEGESDEEPNGDAPVVDLTGDSDDSLSDSDSLSDLDGDVHVAGGGPNDDMDAFSSCSEVDIVDEVHVDPDEHENPPPGQHGGGGRSVSNAYDFPAGATV